MDSSPADMLTRRWERGVWALGISVGAVAAGLLWGAPSPAEAGGFYAARADSVSAFAHAYQRPTSIPEPEDNAYTPARAMLGKTLFFDPRISGSGFMSCASCHNPSLAWGDGNARAVGDGMKVLDRRTPTVLNLAWAAAMFWDGRAETLEEQALGPIEAAGEMNMPLDRMEAKLRSIAGYQKLFEAAYPGEGINRSTVARAIAAYERTIVSGTAPFDRWIAGDPRAISAEAQLGFQLFNGKASCASCHSGWRFTDDSFHDIGVPGEDVGRGKVLDLPSMQYAFKTPTLRNVDQRSPFMHDGSEATLEEVVELYDAGGRVKRPSLSPEIRPLGLSTAEKRALVAFMRTLTSEDKPVVVPVLPH